MNKKELNREDWEYIALSTEIASRVKGVVSQAFWESVAHNNFSSDFSGVQKAVDNEVEKYKPVIQDFFISSGYDLEQMSEFISEAVQFGLSDIAPK